MPNAELPPEIISLIHHVELNKAGWLDIALRRFLTLILQLSGRPMLPRALATSLDETFGLRVDETTIRRTADYLCSAGVLVRLPGGDLKLTEAHGREVQREAQVGRDLEATVKTRFAQHINAVLPNLPVDETWAHFTDLFLIPFVREMGARTYELLSSDAPHLDRALSFLSFLRRYPEDLRPALQSALTTFLDPKEPAVRTYILGYLNAYFLIEAASLPASTLERLTDLSRAKPSFVTFLDTNLLFSILALHDNPANDAATALIELAKVLPAGVTLQLYVTPMTLDETRRTLIAYRDSLRRLRLTPNLADAMTRGQLSGITMKFAQEASRARRSFDADAYFSPFIDNLLTLLRARGIELYNESMDRLRSSQDVIDDLNNQLEYQKEHFGDDAKGYEQLLHDVVLWHFARSKRSVRVESPLEARFWVATIDFGLLGFDSYKRRHQPTEPRVCVHPASLVQMLQFWVPRTSQFEEAIVSSITESRVIQ